MKRLIPWERATNPAGPWTILSSTLPANTTTYTATGLTTSTTYYFRVKATNASGSSAYSATVSATPVSVVRGIGQSFHGRTESAISQSRLLQQAE